MAYSIISVENLAELKTRRGNATNTTMATMLGLNYPTIEAFAVYVWDNLSTATPDDNQIIQPTVNGILTGRWFKVDIGIDTALIIAALGYVPYDASNPLGFISSFIETDPVWTGVASNYRTKVQNDLIYEPLFSKNNAFNKNFGTLSGTVSEGNDSRIINGQTAFGWGNHLGLYPLISGSYSDPTWIVNLAYSKLTGTPTIPTNNNQLVNGNGYITASSTNTLTNKSGNISQWINDTGYLTGITSGQITIALGFNPITSARTITINGTTQDLSTDRTWSVGDVTTSTLTSGLATKENNITSGTTSQYWRGDKTWQTLDKSSVGLSNVDNTSDVNKPVSTATQTALNAKQATLISATNIKTINGSSLLGSGDLTVGNTYTAGLGISISSNVVTNTAPDQTVTLTAGNRILITGTYPNFTISYAEPTINTPVARTLNSNFTISTTKQAMVSYSVTCSVTNPLLVGTSTAMSYLEYSTNAGSTWLLPAQNGNSSGVGITVTLQLTNGQTGTLVGVIPSNALVRLRTATTGTASVTYVTGTEIY